MAEDNSGMSCLHNPKARAINPEFAEAWKEHQDPQTPKEHPIKEEDAQAFRDALAACAIKNGKQLGRVLGLTARSGQILYKNPEKITPENFRKLGNYCSACADRAAEWYFDECEVDERYGGNEDGVTKAREELERIDEACYFFHPQSAKELERTASWELPHRCLVDGFNLLSTERRRALMLTMQGLLAAEYVNISQATDQKREQRGIRILKTCRAVREAIDSTSSTTKVKALVNLLAGKRVDYLYPLENEHGKPWAYEDRYGDKPNDYRLWSSPTEAVMAEYVENIER